MTALEHVLTLARQLPREQLVELLSHLADDLQRQPQPSLAEELLAARAQIVASGVPLLNWDELAVEVAERSGER